MEEKLTESENSSREELVRIKSIHPYHTKMVTVLQGHTDAVAVLDLINTRKGGSVSIAAVNDYLAFLKDIDPDGQDEFLAETYLPRVSSILKDAMTSLETEMIAALEKESINARRSRL